MRVRLVGLHLRTEYAGGAAPTLNPRDLTEKASMRESLVGTIRIIPIIPLEYQIQFEIPIDELGDSHILGDEFEMRFELVRGHK